MRYCYTKCYVIYICLFRVWAVGSGLGRNGPGCLGCEYWCFGFLGSSCFFGVDVRNWQGGFDVVSLDFVFSYDKVLQGVR